MATFTAYTGAGDTSLATALLARNSGITVLPGSLLLSASGPGAVNFYDGSLAPLGIGAGLLLTSGTTPGAVNSQPWFGSDNGASGDADIDAVVNTVFQTQSYDATTLAFDFTVADPGATSVSFDLVLGSDEFPEWVDQFVDSAIVMVNGVNYALFNHDPNHPLSVVSANLAAGYFQDNAGNALPIEYDGVSHVLKIVAPVVAGQVNHIKIGIADTGDHIYDSGLFLANFSAGTIPGSGVVAASDAGTSGNDMCSGSAKDEYFNVLAGDDTVYAGAGDDIVVAGSGNDQLYGGSGADQLKGDAGDDMLDGGADADTAVYSGAKSGYAIAFDAASGQYSISSAQEGSDTLTGVEFAQFADGAWSLGADGSVTPAGTPGGGGAANQPGLAFIAGAGAAGQTLTATVSDSDGIGAGAVSYNWQADGVDLGVGGGTLLVGADQVGRNITVTASYTDLAGHAESVDSAAKYIAPAGDGDFAISLMQLSAPLGASVMNPLTSLVQNAMMLGESAGQAALIVKQVLGLGANVDVLHQDSWAALQANPADAAALALEKKLVQVAVAASLGGDETGMAITQAILLAHAGGTTIDLANQAQLSAMLGIDPAGSLAHEIWDRNDTIASAGSVAAINTIWLDLQSGLDVVLSPSIGTLSTHINQAPVGSASANLAAGGAGADYLIQASDLLLGFSDPDGGTLQVASLAVDGNGSLAANGDGSAWVFSPAADFAGPVELTYVVSDGQGGSIGASQMFVIAGPALPPPNSPPQGTLAVSGAAVQGQMLSVAAALSDADGMGTLSYAWLADGAPVAGATGASLTLAQAQVGKAISVVASYVDGAGHAESVASAATAPVANVNDAPTGGVTVTGSAVQGQQLGVASTLADADGMGALSYQWRADGAAIAGATAATLQLTDTLVGKAISVAVRYTDGHGALETAASGATPAVQGYQQGGGGADTLNGTAYADLLAGGDGNDTLNGNGGNDRLDGGGGADTLLGGAGDDVYVVDHAADKVLETTSVKTKTDAGGVDTVESGVDWTLGSFVENLTLTGAAANGSGNALANQLTGNAGANVLNGLGGNDALNGGDGADTLNGGAGNDSMQGGAGADIFRFDTTPLNASTNRDTILDFQSGLDRIVLEHALFKKLAIGASLNAANFCASASGFAADSNDYVLYNTTSGALSYDADGSGKGAAIQFAVLVGTPALSAADFSVI